MQIHFGHHSSLLLAARNNYVDAVRLLLAAGADVEGGVAAVQGADGWTPLLLASRDGHVEVAQLLIAAGATGVIEGT